MCQEALSLFLLVFPLKFVQYSSFFVRSLHECPPFPVVAPGSLLAVLSILSIPAYLAIKPVNLLRLKGQIGGSVLSSLYLPPPLIKLSYFNLFQCVIFSFFCLCAYVNLNLSLVVNAYLAFNVWFLNIKTNCFLYFFFLFIFYVNVPNLAHARIMDKKS